MVAKSAVEERPPPASTLLGQEALLESLRRINLEFLLWMSELAQDSSYESLNIVGNLSPLFRDLTPEAAAQAARFPFLLLDLHFSEPSWWAAAARRERLSVKDSSRLPGVHYFGAYSVTHSALMLAWHAVRTEREASIVLLGLTAASANALGAMTLFELESISLQDSIGIRPRWSNSPGLWTQLLLRPHTAHLNIARDFVVHALQLTAATHLR